MWLRCLDGSPGIHGNTDRTGCKEQEINTFFRALSSKSSVIVTFQHWDDSLKCFTESKHLEQQTCPPPRVGALHLKGSQAKENLELHYIILIQGREEDVYLEAVHHGDKEGNHQDVVEVWDLEEAACWGLLHSAVGQVEIHEEVQNWKAPILLLMYFNKSVWLLGLGGWWASSYWWQIVRSFHNYKVTALAQRDWLGLSLRY